MRALAQTPEGYLWVGTRAGLARFDGLRMEVFNSLNTPELGNQSINVLWVDDRGGLWVGTNGNGLIYRTPDGRWQRAEINDQLLSGRVITLEPDAAGGLWIGTYGGGLARRHADGHLDLFGAAEGLSGNVVTGLGTDKQGRLWVGTYGGGISILEQGRFRPYANQLPDTGVWTLLRRRDGSLWIGTNSGLLHVDGERTRFLTRADGLSHDRVISLLEDRDDNLWIGTYGGGLHRLTEGRIERFGADHPNASDAIWALLEDHEGGLWVGTLGRGLHHLRDGSVTTFGREAGLESELLISVFASADGHLYAGSRDRGLFVLADGEPPHRFDRVAGIQENDAVWSLEEGADGSLWVATHAGLRRRSPDGRWRTYTTADGLPGNIVILLRRTRDGSLWIGTNDGLGRLRETADGASIETFTRADGLAGDQIRALHESRDGTLWIGTLNGLSAYRDGRFLDDRAFRATGNNVWALHETADGSLWIAAHGAGLLRFHDGTLTVLDQRHGLPDPDLEWVLSDNTGALWLGSSTGVFRLRYDDLLAVIEGSASRLRSTSFGRRDGMRSGECAGGSRSAIRTADGRLWFATREGLSTLDPARVESPPAPPVHIEHLEVDGQRLRPPGPDGVLHLTAGTRSVTLRFAALTLVTPEKVQARLRLRNWDNAWNLVGDQRDVRYTNLDYGSYTFEVTASDRNGNWSDAPAKLTFTIAPHVYETPAFFLLCGLGALALGFGLQQFRVRHLRERERELARRVDDRTVAVRQANEELRSFTHTVSHDLRSPLVNLRGFSQELRFASNEVRATLHEVLPQLDAGQAQQLREALDDMPESLAFIGTAIKRMDRLIGKLSELSRAGARLLSPEPLDVEALVRKLLDSQDFQLQQKRVEVDVGPLPAITADRVAVEQIFGNLLSNAVNYLDPNRPGRLSISGRSVDDRTGGDTVVYQVADNGVGMPPDLLPKIFLPFRRGQGDDIPGEGMGLAFVQALVRSHGGQVHCESVEGEGSVFHVTLPKVTTDT